MVDLKSRLARMPCERRLYALRELCNHLLAAQQFDRLGQLLTDIFFLEGKVEARMVFELATDFTHAVAATPEDRPQQRILRLLEEAIRRDIHFIARHIEDYPQALFQCLWNTCWWYDCPEVAAHYDKTEDRPQRKSHSESHEPELHVLLEKWRCKKEGIAPSSLWLRSLRPPPSPLGSSIRAILSGHAAEVNAVAYSQDGHLIGSGSRDATVRVWYADTGEEALCFRGHSRPVLSVAFSPCGRYVASGSTVSIRVCAIENGHELWNSQTLNSVNRVVFSPEGSIVAAVSDADRGVRIWDASTKRFLVRQALTM